MLSFRACAVAVLVATTGACRRDASEPGAAVLDTSRTAAVADHRRVDAFGFRMGMTLTDLQKYGVLSQKTSLLYRIQSAPHPDGNVKYYRAVIGEVGLCKVEGVGLDIGASPSGSELRSAFYREKEVLESMYGKTKAYDFVWGRRFTADNQFMLALSEGERRLNSYWPNSSQPLPRPLMAVQVMGTASDSSTGFITVSYEFRNFPECVSQLDRIIRSRS